MRQIVRDILTVNMRLVIAISWLMVIGLLVGAVRLPTALDIYVHDRYFVISKRTLVALILLSGVLPLCAVTLSRFRSMPHRRSTLRKAG